MRSGGRIVRRAALLAAAVVLVLAAALAGLKLSGGRRSARSLGLQLQAIDEQAGRGFLGKAEAGLRAAASSARSERDWLRLLKRARELAEATGGYPELAALARRAAEAIPGSRALARLSLYASLRAGRGAEHPSLRGLSSDPDLQYLLAEAAARRQDDASAGFRLPPGELAPELEDLLAAPQAADPESLQALAARWQDDALLRDAGLAWMARGDSRRAAAAFSQLPDGPVARELSFGAAYDAGSWREALAMLEREAQPSAETLLMRADLLRLLGRDPEAAGLYREVIAREPKLFWTPYQNLGDILESRGEAEAAGEQYRRAWELFPDSEEAAAALLSSLVRGGRQEQAFAVLQRALERFPGSLPLAWLLLELRREQGGAPEGEQRYLAGLRRLQAEHPRSAPLAQALAVHLLGLLDTAGAWAVLEQYQGPAEEPWLLEARGLVKGLEGEPGAGVDFLRRSLQAGGDGRVRYNLAVLLAADGETETAARELLQASGQLHGRPRLESRARARLAELLLRLGNRGAARRESAFALELDPANGRALLLLRTLEGE